MRNGHATALRGRILLFNVYVHTIAYALA